MSWVQMEVRELKEGRYILLDNEPCRIVSIATSKPGKHGEAKSRIEAIGVFDSTKRSVVYPVKHKVQVPIIDRKAAQVLSVRAGTNDVQLMDMTTYEVFDVKFDEDLRERLEPGKEITYLSAMGRRKIVR